MERTKLTQMMNFSPIIEVEDLLKLYKNSEVMIFDVRSGENAEANYEAKHLADAFYVDLNTQLADIKKDFADGGRHPLPDIEAFAKTLTDLGISKEKHLVIYDDQHGANASARFWWMLKSAGHEKVQVLNGGLQHAIKNKFPLHSGKETAKKATSSYAINKWKLPTINIEALEKVTHDPNYRVIDVRAKERYDGITEPIDLIAGHIPGAINIPFTENLNQDGKFLNPTTLKTKYEKLLSQVNPENVVVHCGSGVTACHTLLAFDYAGMEMPKLYVGSWSEWSRKDKKIERTNY